MILTLFKDPKKAKSCSYQEYRNGEMAYCGKPGAAKTSKGSFCKEHAAFILSCPNSYELRDGDKHCMSAKEFLAAIEKVGAK